MALDKYSLNKLFKMINKPCCPVRNEQVTTQGTDELEYVKTKRGTEIFIHTKCVKKWSD